MDEAGVAARLRASGPEAVTVGARDAERTVARMARIPERTVSSSDRARLQNLEDELKQAVFGQDPAIAAVARAIKLARSDSHIRIARSERFCSPVQPAWAKPRSRASSQK